MNYFIFDFDGTIVDSLSYIVKIFNDLAGKFHFRKIESKNINQLKDLNSKELVRYLQIPIAKIPRVLYLARRFLNKEIHALKSFPNLPEVLIELKQEDCSFGIVTSNSKENVSTWLQLQKIDSLFNFIHVESNYFGKKHSLEKIIKIYEIDKQNAFYIGDETRDIEAAKHCHIYSVAVTWGFNSEKTLLSYEPDYLARKPEDLLAIQNGFKRC